MPIFGLIPARGNSKGIKKKNLALVGGRPLLSLTAEAALASKYLDGTFLSTDSEEIASVGKALGVQIPFLRPAEIAVDTTPMIEVLQHFLRWCESSYPDAPPEALVLLQPTSPFRTSTHIDGAIELWKSSGADTVVSVVAVPHQYHPDSVQKISADGQLSPWNPNTPAVLRRQDKTPVFARNGPAVLVLSVEQIRSGNLYGGKTVGYLMSEEDSLDIDTPFDLEYVNFKWGRHHQ